MAKVKYDVSNVEDIADRTPAPVGIYTGKVVKCDGPKPSSKGNQMLEVQFTLTHNGAGKKLKPNEFGDVWMYPILDHDHPFVQATLKEFLLAFGFKPKGVLDTDKILGQSVQLKLKSDTDQDGEYRPRIGKIMAAVEDTGEEEPEDDDAEEDDDEEGIDLDALDRKQLRALIKEESLEIRVLKSMSDDDIREAIAEALGEDEEEEEPDDEEEDDEPDEDEEEAEDDGYDDMSIADLKAELKERELPSTGAKKILVARLRKDDGADAF